MADSKHFSQEQEFGVIAEIRHETKTPALYKVLLHNDDYTSQEFVVLILQAIFHQSEAKATQIMLSVHQQGVGVAGIYPYEIAETKVARVLGLAKQYQYPLQCSLEQE